MNRIGFKDFENVKLKATYDIEIGNRLIQAGETHIYFDTIQIAGLKEVTEIVSANGGYGNVNHVIWETTKDIELTFSNGVFSKSQLAILTNSRLIQSVTDNLIISYREILESDENGNIECKFTPVNNVFLYNKNNGNKITFIQNGKILHINEPFIDVIVDYNFEYDGQYEILKIGEKLLNGFVELEGTTRVKDDITGHVTTGIIKIPKLRLMSKLSIRLGKNASPIAPLFTGVGVPVGQKGNYHVADITFLSDDIYSQI